MAKSVAIVPARGGSKRLPRKNVKSLAGIPLIGHTLRAAEDSNCFDDILLSTDDEEIREIGEIYAGVEVVERSEALSRDKVTALEVVISLIYEKNLHENFDMITLLLPTAPFRTASHIKSGFQLFDDNTDGVISLTHFEFPPQLSVNLVNGLIEPSGNNNGLFTGDTRSQDQAPIFRPNGGFYIQKMSSFLRNKNFWKGRVKGYIMDRKDSVDIDTQLDLTVAEIMYESITKSG